MKYFYTVLLLFCVINFLSGQELFTSKVNTSSLGTVAPATITSQAPNNIYIAFRRGGGSTTVERENKIATSTDSGKTFKETDITIPNTYTDWPRIASTATTVLAVYRYTDAANALKVGIAISNDHGKSFTESSSSNPDFVNAAAGLGTLNEFDPFVSDGASKFYLLGHHRPGGIGGETMFDLTVSTDNGATFKYYQLPVVYDDKTAIRLAASPTQLWFTYVPIGQDSIVVYRSGNDGQSWSLVGKFLTDGLISNNYARSYDIVAKGDQLNIYYTRTVLSSTTTYKRIATTSAIGSELSVGNFVVMRSQASSNNVFIETPNNTMRQSAIAQNNWSPEYDYLNRSPYYNPTLYIVTDNLYGALYFVNTTSSLSYSTFKFSNKPQLWGSLDTLLESGKINLEWTSFFNTGNFRVQLSKSSNFASTIWDTIVVTQGYSNSVSVKNISKLFGADSGKVYFRIRAEEISYTSEWSDLRSLTFFTSPYLPVNGALFSNAPNVSPYTATIQFSWPATTNALSYLLQLGETEQFQKLLYFSGDGLLISANEYTLLFNSLIFNNQKVYWRVRANYSGGAFSSWSATRSFSVGNVTDVRNDINEMITNYSLHQNYPNPFNPSTTIRYSLLSESRVKLQIFNTLGQVIAEILNTTQSQGEYEANWNANVPGGVYFYRLEAAPLSDPSKRFVETRRMILLK